MDLDHEQKELDTALQEGEDLKRQMEQNEDSIAYRRRRVNIATVAAASDAGVAAAGSHIQVRP